MSSNKKLKKFKSILIDFDGTLFDSEYSNYCAYKKAIEETGFKVQSDRLRNLITGNHWTEFLPILLNKKYTPQIGILISEKKREIYPEFFNKINLNLKLFEIVKRYPRRKRAIVSNASSITINLILENFKLIDEFPFIICPDSSFRPKPFPDIYIYAAKKLNTSINDIIAVEDSKTGYVSAKNAGLYCMYLDDFINEYY